MKTNIVLIGLMGCGKSTVGKRLSPILKMNFIDIDDDIVKHYGPIKGLFEKGETHFRDIESQRVNIISQKSHSIISTGGGVVLQPFNMDALKRDGMIFYLTRPVKEIIESVDPSNRPLLKDGIGVLNQLYKEREPLYLKYSDHIVESSDINSALLEIISLWNQRS